MDTATSRTTSQYTLTLHVYDDDAAAVQALLSRVLSTLGLMRTATVGDRTHAGVSWRSGSDEWAHRIGSALEQAAADRGFSILGARLHTGYGIHTRDLTPAAHG